MYAVIVKMQNLGYEDGAMVRVLRFWGFHSQDEGINDSGQLKIIQDVELMKLNYLNVNLVEKDTWLT